MNDESLFRSCGHEFWTSWPTGHLGPVVLSLSELSRAPSCPSCHVERNLGRVDELSFPVVCIYVHARACTCVTVKRVMGLFCLCFFMGITNSMWGCFFGLLYLDCSMFNTCSGCRYRSSECRPFVNREHVLPRTSALFIDERCLVYFIWFVCVRLKLFVNITMYLLNLFDCILIALGISIYISTQAADIAFGLFLFKL